MSSKKGRREQSLSSLGHREHRLVLIETGQTVAGCKAHHCSPLLRRGEAAESPCQISSCTTDCNYLAWFWPGLALHYCVPACRPVPSACCHQPITRCLVPSGGLTWNPAGFHPAQRKGLCQELKMCGGVHHQAREVITNFTITNRDKHSTASQECNFQQNWTLKSRMESFLSLNVIRSH